MASASIAGAVRPGDMAPGFQLDGAAGAVSLDAFRGRHVYVDFWASWCAPCKLSFPWLNRVQARWPQLAIVGINVDRRREDAERFLRATPARFTIAYDATGATPAAYAVKTMPSAYLIGPDGRVLWVHRGFREGDAAALDAALDQVLGGTAGTDSSRGTPK
jgi:thiol-disulfide isomerase/thioredoxin